MKKIFSSVIVMISLTFCMNSQAYELSDFEQSLVMYVPNRVMDTLDIFSLSAGLGPKAALQLRASRVVTAGGSIGGTAKLVKAYDRQYGYAVEDADQNYAADLFFFTAEKNVTLVSSRFVDKLDIERIGAITPSDRVYDFYEGSRDYWSIGFSVALIGDVEFDLHLLEVFDLIGGIFLIDFKADDYDVYSVAGTREVEL